MILNSLPNLLIICVIFELFYNLPESLANWVGS